MSSEIPPTDLTEETPAMSGLEVRVSLAPPPVWQTVLLALSVIVSFMLGSGWETWSFGAVVCVVGITVVCCAPWFRLPKTAGFSLIALGLVPLVGLLPVDWLGGVEPWRQALWDSWGIALPKSLSPVPFATVEAWMSVLVALIWFWCCLAHGASDAGRRWAIYTLALGGALVAGASWFDAYVQMIPWWPHFDIGKWATFGPFSNRNHTASLNAISCVLCAASAYDAYRRKSKLAWLFALTFLLPFTAILANTSRGGVLLLFIGMTAWTTTAAMKKGMLRKLAVGFAIVIVMASIASVSGGKLGSRIRSLIQDDKLSPLTSSMRVDLARQMVQQFSEDPWVGKGLGTFSSVFPQVSTMRNPFFKFWHPESDVLLLLFEGGLLVGVPCGVLLFWIARSTGPWKTSRSDKSRDRSGRRLRQAAAIGGGMALLHSCFDMPNHILAYAMQTMLLFGLAIRPQFLTVSAGWVSKGVIRLLAVVILGAGILWLGIGLGHWSPDLKSSVVFLREKAVIENQEGRYREALSLVDRCIWLSPMDFRLYYLRAQLLLRLRQRPERALVEFGRSRALEPDYAHACYTEGLYWLKVAPELAMIPWRESLAREERGGVVATRNYQMMVSSAVPFPELSRELWGLADNVNRQMIFLEHTMPDAEWSNYLAEFLQKHPKLELLDSQQLRLLMKLWDQRGDRAKLIQLLEKNQDLQPFGWRTLASEMARQGRYQEALLIAKKFLKRPGKPSVVGGTDLPRLERAFLFNPTDIRPGVELYFAQRAGNDLKGARLTAEKVTALPNAPAYMKIELALLYAQMDDQRRAWEMMEQAIENIPES